MQLSKYCFIQKCREDFYFYLDFYIKVCQRCSPLIMSFLKRDLGGGLLRDPRRVELPKPEKCFIIFVAGSATRNRPGIKNRLLPRPWVFCWINVACILIWFCGLNSSRNFLNLTLKESSLWYYKDEKKRLFIVFSGFGHDFIKSTAQ